MFDNSFELGKMYLKQNLTYDTSFFGKCVTIVRYLITTGHTDEEIREIIEEKTKNIYKDYNKKYSEAEVNTILKAGFAKGVLPERVEICFSKEELEEIHSVDNKNTEKILFVLMCLSKVNKGEPFSFQRKDLLKAAGVSNNSGYYDKLMYEIVGKRGYFKSNVYKNKLSYSATEKTLDLFNEDNIVLRITNYNNIVYYYLDYIGDGKFFICPECGSIDKKTSNNKKICSDCSKENRVSYQSKYYEKRKENK